MTHTPGPWHVHVGEDETASTVYVYADPDPAPDQSGEDRYICQMMEDSSGIVDAHLIAAAPKLLEALEAVLEVAEESTDYTDDGLYWVTQAIIKARTAIAKAKGQ